MLDRVPVVSILIYVVLQLSESRIIVTCIVSSKPSHLEVVSGCTWHKYRIQYIPCHKSHTAPGHLPGSMQCSLWCGAPLAEQRQVGGP